MENEVKNRGKTAFLRVFGGFWGGGKSSKQCIFRDFPTQTLARLPHFLVFSGVPRQTPRNTPQPQRVKIAAFRGFFALQNRGFGHPATHPPTGPKWDVGWGGWWFSGRPPGITVRWGVGISTSTREKRENRNCIEEVQGTEEINMRIKQRTKNYMSNRNIK